MYQHVVLYQKAQIQTWVIGETVHPGTCGVASVLFDNDFKVPVFPRAEEVMQNSLKSYTALSLLSLSLFLFSHETRR